MCILTSTSDTHFHQICQNKFREFGFDSACDLNFRMSDFHVKASSLHSTNMCMKFLGEHCLMRHL